MLKEAESLAEMPVKVGQATATETAEVATDTTVTMKEGVAAIMILPIRIAEEVVIGIGMKTLIGGSGKSDADGDVIGTDATTVTTNTTDATAGGMIGGLLHHLLPAPLAGVTRAEGGEKVMVGAIAMTVVIEGTATDVATVGITEVRSICPGFLVNCTAVYRRS